MDENDWVHEYCGGEISGSETTKYGYLYSCDNCSEQYDDEGMFNQVRRRNFVARSQEEKPSDAQKAE